MNFMWHLIPKEEDDDGPRWRVGLQDNTHWVGVDQPDPYWFAGFGEFGERRWVKSYNDAMTFSDKDEAVKFMDEIEPTISRDCGYLFVQIRKSLLTSTN